MIRLRMPHVVMAAAIVTSPLSRAAPAGAATLTVTVSNVRSAQGHVRIGVCKKPEFLSEHCSYHAIVSAHPGLLTATIPDVASGLYAVAVYHDETDAGHLRRGLFGIPKDGAGFSRDPKPGFGPPDFAQCALQVGPRDGAVAVGLRYP